MIFMIWEMIFHSSTEFFLCHVHWDHPFKTSACLRGEGCPHGPMVKRSQYILKDQKSHFAGMPNVGGGGGVKNREYLPKS